jgi:hypothetical protein
VGIGNITKSQKKHAGILVLKASVQIVSGFFRVPKRFQKALTIGFLLPVSFGIQILLPVFLRRQDVLGLCSFVTAAKQDHNQRTLPAVVDPIPWAEIDPQFLDAAPDRPAVSEIAQPDPIETRADNTNRPGVPQRSKPVRKGSRLGLAVKENLNLLGHNLTVAYKLPGVKQTPWFRARQTISHMARVAAVTLRSS